MLSVFVSALERTHIHEDKPPWSVLRYRVEKQWKNSGKCSKAIKKQAKNLHK